MARLGPQPHRRPHVRVLDGIADRAPAPRRSGTAPSLSGQSTERAAAAIEPSADGQQSSHRLALHDVKLNPVDRGVIVDRTGVGGPIAKRLSITFARTANVCRGHRREGQ